MARRASKRERGILIPDAVEAVHKFKFEMATELGENPGYYNQYWGNISTRELDQAGGHVVRQMIAKAEDELRAREGGFK